MWGIWIIIGIIVGVISTFFAFRSERTRLATQFRQVVDQITAASNANVQKADALHGVAIRERERGDEWKAEAGRRGERILELTNRLLRQANVPSMEDPDAEDSPTVAQADARAAAESRMEPLHVGDATVEPPLRLASFDEDDESGWDDDKDQAAE